MDTGPIGAGVSLLLLYCLMIALFSEFPKITLILVRRDEVDIITLTSLTKISDIG